MSAINNSREELKPLVEQVEREAGEYFYGGEFSGDDIIDAGILNQWLKKVLRPLSDTVLKTQQSKDFKKVQEVHEQIEVAQHHFKLLERINALMEQELNYLAVEKVRIESVG